MASGEALKKPQTAYWLWLADNREKISKALGSAKASDVAKRAGEMWKALSEVARAPYEKKAKEQKDAYDKLINTEEGKKALDEKKAAKADAKAEKDKKGHEKAEKLAAKEERRNERACSAALKLVVKDDALKKPVSAYWLWLGDNRQTIVTMLGSAKGPDVAKKGGEMWKALSDAKRALYEKMAKEQKETYDKYVSSEEGAAALKAFKEAQQATKDQFKTKETSVETEPAKDDIANNKRKAAQVAEEEPADAKKPRGRPSKVQVARLGA